jgi:nucleolar pre-ribosomal-associated protein 1
LQQLYLLLGEVLESAEACTDSPFPYVGGVFAAHCVQVIADPTHFMFGKINTFLTNRPSWDVKNLPRKFMRLIINSQPDEDDSYHKEVDWFLEYLLDCLRTPEDMEIFRIDSVFERLLSYYVAKSCAISAKEKIVRILLRAAAVGGGTTLITRCGLVSWIQMMLDNRDHRQGALRVLAGRIYELCDREKVDTWSSGSVGGVVKSIQQRVA